MPPTRRRPPIRWSTRIAGGVALMVITVSGIGHGLVNGVSDAIGRVDAFGGMEGRPDGTKGTNYLLVGTDGRDGLAPAEKQRFHLGGAPCHCTDTIMLVHLSEDRSRVSIVSIPRDTYVRLPVRPDAPTGPTRPAKINAAYSAGGPKLTVRTVERLTGVHIDHYLEIDFISFMKTVDVLGGVPVCTTRPLKDAYTGLDLPAGTTLLDGGRALQYVRSRHLDGAADLGRMQRQQRFVAQIMRRISSGGALTNPLEMSQIASTVLGSLRADQGLNATDMIALARGMKGFSTRSSEFGSVPLSDTNFQVKGIGSTVKWDTAKAGPMWAAIRADEPLASHQAPAGKPGGESAQPGSGQGGGQPGGGGGQGGGGGPQAQAPAPASAPAPAGVKVAVDPAQIRVSVANGTDTSGLATSAQKALRATGFATTGVPVTAPQHSAHTVIRYDPRWDRSAKALAGALPGAQLVAVNHQGPVMQVTLGPDFHAVTPVTVDRPDTTGTQQKAMTGDEVGC
ncbi:LCP family protein [Streptomyces sp. NPDC051976]|uniref:LCP family protein n=1 Tax=Streptomyces sp. NPDC051976 TaxID=3154947 RepID=UPI00343AE877